MSSKPTDTIPALAANAYHDGYVDGLKVALELVQYAIDYDTAQTALKRMVDTITNKQETK